LQTTAKLLLPKLSLTSSPTKDNEAAQKAITELDGGIVEGRAIKVTEARPREERSNNGGGGGKRSFAPRSNNYNNRY
jgi:RNA recognition motif-containing protein